MIHFGFTGEDTLDEIYEDRSVESIYRDHHLRTFTWGRYRGPEFHAELKHLKNDLEGQPNWNVHVPLLYLYGGKDPWINDKYIECVIKNMKYDVPRIIVKYPCGKYLLPIKDSSKHVNQFV